MNEQTTKQTTLTDAFKSAAGWSIGLAILMIVVGMLAIYNPFAAGLGISMVFGWLIVFGGFLHAGYAFAAGGVGSFLWRLLIGMLYILGGFYLILNPPLALASLTIVLAVILIAEGVLQFIAFYQLRSLPGAGWILFDGIMSVVLGILILYPFPQSSEWAIGTIFGVNMLFSGFTRLMYSIAARKIFSSTAAQG
jgi:uncharacterized membrane protein HdeD (DUF308 family)